MKYGPGNKIQLLEMGFTLNCTQTLNITRYLFYSRKYGHCHVMDWNQDFCTSPAWDDQRVGAKVRAYSERILLKPGHEALNGAAD